MSDHTRADEGEGREPGQDDEARALIASLEKELGVTGTANVFRKALAIAKEAAAIARVRQETYAADQLVERLRSWGENDADPEFFTGDLLSGVLMDCGMGSEAIVSANLRAAQAEAEVARLTAALAISEIAVRSLRARVAVPEEALRFYADESNYSLGGPLNTECTDCVGPDAARAALNAGDHAAGGADAP